MIVYTRSCLYPVFACDLFWLGIGAKPPNFPNYSLLTKGPLQAQSPKSDSVT